LLNELTPSATPINPSTGDVATKAILSDNPSANITGSTQTLTNLSVTVLNPDMTSDAGAITDTQVNADAYLVPSTTDLLDDHLGVNTIPAIMRGNTTNSTVYNAAFPSPAAISPGHGAGASFGQPAAAPPSISAQASASAEFAEPTSAVAPAELPLAQPTAQQNGNPASAPGTQPGGQGATQSPAAGAATQPGTPAGETPSSTSRAQPGGQGGDAPAPEGSDSPAPQVEAGSGEASAYVAPAAKTNDSAVDAALGLVDVRALARETRGEGSPADPAHESQAAWGVSPIMAAAVIATGGYQMALGQLARSRSRRLRSASRPV
jgi:hypothetical protein